MEKHLNLKGIYFQKSLRIPRAFSIELTMNRLFLKERQRFQELTISHPQIGSIFSLLWAVFKTQKHMSFSLVDSENYKFRIDQHLIFWSQLNILVTNLKSEWDLIKRRSHFFFQMGQVQLCLDKSVLSKVPQRINSQTQIYLTASLLPEILLWPSLMEDMFVFSAISAWLTQNWSILKGHGKFTSQEAAKQ